MKHAISSIVLAACVAAIPLGGCANPASDPAAIVISYDANGATKGTVPSSQELATLSTAGTPSGLFKARKGVSWSTFAGWNTKADGSGSAYAAGASISTTASLTLYAQWRDLAVGDLGPAGGYIFYDAGSYQTDATNGDWRYMEAGLADLPLDPGAASPDYGIPFDTSGEASQVYGTLKGIGFGLANSKLLVPYVSDADNAVPLCEASAEGGFDDWYLPSLDELEAMNENLFMRDLGSIASRAHWSSSIDSGNLMPCAWQFDTGRMGTGDWGDRNAVRAARRF